MNIQSYTKHYYIESDRFVSKIGGGMANINYNIREDHVYGMDINDPSDYENKSRDLFEDGMMSRHFDIIDVHTEVIKDYDFRQISKFQEYDEVEKHFFFYHKDHLGSSTQISDRDAKIIHHVEYMPSGEQFSEQRDWWSTPYKFNGKELDQETGLYYYGARYYTPEIGIWLSVDPLSDKYPSMSAYMYCAGNPVMLVDPDGRDIDPDAPGYNNAKNAATPGHDSYQPAFAKLYNGWKENGSINVQFIDNMANSESPDAAGTVERGEVDNKGVDGAERTNYKVFWDSSNSTTEKLGTSALFEESKHLEDGLSGKFSINTGGCAGFDTMNEVEAKQWVVDNISGIKDKYVDKNDNHLEKQTHYSRIKSNSGNHAKILKELRGGATGIGRSKNEIQGRNYSIFGFGGYK